MKCFFDEQDLHDILSGSVFLACGGGCSIVGGKKMMDAVLNITDKVEYVPFENVDKGKFMAVHAGMGSSGALKENPPLEFGTLRSFNLLEDTLKKKLFATGRKGEYSLSYVVPVESSALAYFMCMLTGVQKKIPVLDGDGGGRAFPKLSMCTFASVGVPVSPAVLVNELPMDDGGTELIMNQESSDVVDELCRAVLDTPVFNNAASLAGFAMSGETLHRENAVVRNTLTKARDIGRVIRKNPNEAVEAVISLLKAHKLFDGAVVDISEQSKGGFNIGTVVIENGKNKVHVLNQNENIIVWSSEKNYPVAMAPDLICYLGDDGKPVSNTAMEKGQYLTLIGVEAPKEMTTRYIINEFSGLYRSFEYFGPYVPLKDIRQI
ncbi:MAG TPA: DUF917 domain-containing protein [Desulfobacterales bacterium]|nr:MAG: hypothetical protein DRI57_12925 [Deltaproteobacteria bacterium]HHC24038.1 DUF917 domain-containing protein [Desulfobacterales bacterium]